MADLRLKLGSRVDAVDRHPVPTMRCSCGGATWLVTYKAAALGALGWQCVDCAGDKGIRAELVDYYLYSAVRVHSVGVTIPPDMPALPELPPAPEQPVPPPVVRPIRAPGVTQMLKYNTGGMKTAEPADP